MSLSIIKDNSFINRAIYLKDFTLFTENINPTYLLEDINYNYTIENSDIFLNFIYKEILRLLEVISTRAKALTIEERQYLKNGPLNPIIEINTTPFNISPNESLNKLYYEDLARFFIYLLRIYIKDKENKPIYTILPPVLKTYLELVYSLKEIITNIVYNTFTSRIDIRFNIENDVILILDIYISEILLNILAKPTIIDSTELITKASPLYSYLIIRSLKETSLNNDFKLISKIQEITDTIIYNTSLTIILNIYIRETIGVFRPGKPLINYIISFYKDIFLVVDKLRVFSSLLSILENNRISNIISSDIKDTPWDNKATSKALNLGIS